MQPLDCHESPSHNKRGIHIRSLASPLSPAIALTHLFSIQEEWIFGTNYSIYTPTTTISSSNHRVLDMSHVVRDPPIPASTSSLLCLPSPQYSRLLPCLSSPRYSSSFSFRLDSFLMHGTSLTEMELEPSLILLKCAASSLPWGFRVFGRCWWRYLLLMADCALLLLLLLSSLV